MAEGCFCEWRQSASAFLRFLIQTDNLTSTFKYPPQTPVRNMGIVAQLWPTPQNFILSCSNVATTLVPPSAQWPVPDNNQKPEWPTQNDFGALCPAQRSKWKEKQWTSDQQVWAGWAGGLPLTWPVGGGGLLGGQHHHRTVQVQVRKFEVVHWDALRPTTHVSQKGLVPWLQGPAT